MWPYLTTFSSFPRRRNRYISHIFQIRWAILRSLSRRRSSQRRYWVHPILEQKQRLGSFSCLYHELRCFPEKFFNYMRMTPDSFDALVELLSPRISPKPCRFRRNISPTERLMVTLRFLATGESYASLHYQFRIGKSTISNIIKMTCEALWETLQPLYLPQPNQETWLEVADKFYKITQFPNCVGALDGKHIRIQKPPCSGSQFFHYKKFQSIQLMAIADSDYKFICVDIGAFGRNNDSGVFRNSTMGKKLYSNNLHLPQPRPLPGTENPSLPFVLVGDEAFTMCPNLLKPYPQRNLSYKKKIFNYRLTRARRLVECAFGILAGKWRILRRAIQADLKTIDHIVKACVVLHNFIRIAEPHNVPEEYIVSSLTDVDEVGYRPRYEALTVREEFADYFVSDIGKLEWQDSMI